MSKSPSSPRTAIVCMVYNGYEYISEFILHHLVLCDHVFLIDHNSKADLRQLNMENVTVVRSNHEAQFQSECTNIVIEHFGIKQNYDWLFVLDIDEFLPFSSRTKLHQFLEKHNNTPVLQFHWRNGVPFYDQEKEHPKSLIDCKSIRFFHKQGRQYKSFVNIRKVGDNFFVPTGAHHIARIHAPFLSFIKSCKHYRAKTSEIALFHILAFNKDSFVKKIKNYVEQMKYREHIVGQGGWMVRDYPDDFSGDEWLWYVANFRVSNPDEHYDVKTEYFEEHDVIGHLDKEAVLALRERIFSFDTIEKQKALPEEKEYLSNKKDDRDVPGNIRWFTINTDYEILTVIPGEQK